MTPRERADEVMAIEYLDIWNTEPRNQDEQNTLLALEVIRDRIEAAIIAATEAERERCAKIADSMMEEVPGEIATAIRASEEPRT